MFHLKLLPIFQKSLPKPNFNVPLSNNATIGKKGKTPLREKQKKFARQQCQMGLEQGDPKANEKQLAFSIAK
jgi:hypothetical protein